MSASHHPEGRFFGIITGILAVDVLECQNILDGFVSHEYLAV
ncbi:MAG: hypothetical protein WCY13_04795 [Candidatus Cloacimonadaceae bacterium]